MRGSGEEFTFFRGKLKLVQPERHRVSVDLVVFLSKVRGVRRRSKVVDLGAGFGFLSLVVAKKFGVRVWAVERDPEMLSLLKENIKMNGLEDLVIPVEGDVRAPEGFLRRSSFDVVIANPPFFPSQRGNGVRFEGDTKLADFLRASAFLLRDGGYLNILIPSFRLYETFVLMSELNLPPRFLTLIFPKLSKKGKLSVVTSVKNVPGPLHVEEPCVINREDGSYTDEVRSVLEGFL